jgi:putative hemolysin
VPWERVVKVNIDDPPSSLWALADQTSLSRFPVVDDEGIVLGIVSLYDALQHEQDQCPSIGTLMKPAPAIEAGTLLRLALDRFQREKLALAIVVGEQYTPRGLVTVKDLIEPIIGDLASW